MSDNLPYYLGFSHCLGIGPVRFKQLIDYFGNVKKAYTANREKLRYVLGPKTTEEFIRFRDAFKTDSILSDLFNKHIQAITLEDLSYPKLLASISDPPLCIYVKGNSKLLSDNSDCLFAIVGTRKATSYGLFVAKTFAQTLSASGFIIVSGMALGIDSAAHWGALAGGGKTIAVLGCGVDVVYPPTNAGLYDKIIASGGAVIGEFPPGHGVAKGLFVARNRIISGLSRGVMIVEGEAQSGSLITARNAAEQGRDVFAPPVPITSIMSQAPNIILKQGATLVTSVDDILDEYKVKKVINTMPKLPDNLDPLSKSITEKIYAEPQTVDELKRILDCDMMSLLNNISILELQGIIEKNNEGKFYLKG